MQLPTAQDSSLRPTGRMPQHLPANGLKKNNTKHFLTVRLFPSHTLAVSFDDLAFLFLITGGGALRNTLTCALFPHPNHRMGPAAWACPVGRQSCEEHGLKPTDKLIYALLFW